MPARIVVVGSYNSDLVMYMPHLPRPGQTVDGRQFVVGPGGKGSNQAVAAARLGAQVAFIGRVGRDDFAAAAFRLWADEGVDASGVTKDDTHGTGVASIFVEQSGQNMIVVAPRANTALSPADLDVHEGLIAGADVLLVQLEVPLATVQYALALARRHGLRTILNPAPASGPLQPELLALADYLTPNETEAALLGELSLHESQTLIVTQGEQGLRWQQGPHSGQRRAYRVQAVDAVGAGDAFNAALAVALAEGQALEQALAFASAAAALSVTRPGAAASMPQRREVEAFLAEREGPADE